MTNDEIQKNDKARMTMPAPTNSMLDAITWSSALFPLTPALSLGERETRNPALGTKNAADWRRNGERFSLSPRERAGVRGKELFGWPRFEIGGVSPSDSQDETLRTFVICHSIFFRHSPFVIRHFPASP